MFSYPFRSHVERRIPAADRTIDSGTSDGRKIIIIITTRTPKQGALH